MKKVLIANRGEIAVRIIRACADHGLASIAVYADDDLEALHVRMADEAHALNGQRPADTYLDIGKLIAAAQRSGADAVHPGYGFLSESAAFARAVIGAGLTWIGPPPEAIELLGDKVSARQLALRVGAPLVAGTAAPVKDVAEIHAFANQHGLPIAIKAAYGGGGRGLKVVWQMDEIDELYASAVREAEGHSGGVSVLSSSFWTVRATSKPRCWPMRMAMSVSSARATAPYSAATRNWWRKRRRPS